MRLLFTLATLLTVLPIINCGWYSETFIPPPGEHHISRERFIAPTSKRGGRLCLFKSYELTSEDMIESDPGEPLCHDYTLKGKHNCDVGLWEVNSFCIQPNTQWRVNYLLPRILASRRNQ